MSPDLALTLDDIRDAAERIAEYVERTPVLRHADIDELAGGVVHLKAEHLQRAGSFKARGAHNRLLTLDAAERARGVVTASSGNHGAALSLAGRSLGVAVEVWMPADAPELKKRAVRGFGADLREFDRATVDRDTLLAERSAETGAVVVPPFDDHDIMAGQGTTALEFHDQARLDALVVPVSGGGLMAGCAVATTHLAPGCRIVGVEPETADDTARSIAAGERIGIDPPETIADGLAITRPGARTFAVNRHLVDEIVTVTDDEIVDAMVVLFETSKQVVEPSGAAALAAVLAGRVSGGSVGVILSGGNVDVGRFTRLVRRRAEP